MILLRTEILCQLNNNKKQYIIVTYLDTIFEKVISHKKLKILH
jgi:hypothetical protein